MKILVVIDCENRYPTECEIKSLDSPQTEWVAFSSTSFCEKKLALISAGSIERISTVSGRNATDFCMSYWIGQTLSSTDEYKRLVIVSHDKGFDSLCEFIKPFPVQRLTTKPISPNETSKTVGTKTAKAKAERAAAKSKGPAQQPPQSKSTVLKRAKEMHQLLLASEFKEIREGDKTAIHWKRLDALVKRGPKKAAPTSHLRNSVKALRRRIDAMPAG